MKIYDAALLHELQNPDLTRGKLEPAQRVTVHHDAVPASVRYVPYTEAELAEISEKAQAEKAAADAAEQAAAKGLITEEQYKAIVEGTENE